MKEHSMMSRLQAPLLGMGLLATLGASAPALCAQDVLVSNLEQAPADSLMVGANWLAQSFKTDGSARQLHSIRFKCIWGGPHGVIKLYSASEGKVGSLLRTFDTSALEKNLFAAMPKEPITLEANTAYWIVFGSGNSTELLIADGTSKSGPGSIPDAKTSATSSDAGKTWVYVDKRSTVFGVFFGSGTTGTAKDAKAKG